MGGKGNGKEREGVWWESLGWVGYGREREVVRVCDGGGCMDWYRGVKGAVRVCMGRVIVMGEK